jgi:hypothetical protein
LQNWVEKLTAIFAGADIKIETEDSGAPKMPLLYVSDALFGKWMAIQESWFTGILPDPFGKYLNYSGDEDADSNDEEGEPSAKKKRPSSKRKTSRALKQHDLQLLYGLRDAEIDKMANLVISKKISVKTTKSTTKEPVLRGLRDLCGEEKKLRIIKNEMMYVFQGHPLPSRSDSYFPYTDGAFDALARQMNVTDSTL